MNMFLGQIDTIEEEGEGIVPKNPNISKIQKKVTTQSGSLHSKKKGRTRTLYRETDPYDPEPLLFREREPHKEIAEWNYSTTILPTIMNISPPKRPLYSGPVTDDVLMRKRQPSRELGRKKTRFPTRYEEIAEKLEKERYGRDPSGTPLSQHRFRDVYKPRSCRRRKPFVC
ncbi:hypothetical protein PCE1_003599 [Barthelona sp. PCE]